MTDTRMEFPTYDAPNTPEYGTGEARIEVGRWGTIYPVSGQGQVLKGKVIVAYGRSGQEVYRETLRGHSRWDAEARNKLGTLGAVFFDPPTDEEEQAAIERARRALVAEANLLAEAPPLREGWSEWAYIPPEPPSEEEGRRERLTSSYRVPTDYGYETYTVSGRDGSWKIETDAISGPGGWLYYDENLYQTAEEAMRICEQAAQG